MEQREQIRRAIAQRIRERSETGQLIPLEEIWAELVRAGLVTQDANSEMTDFKAMLGEVVQENADLKEISTENRIAYYYSSRSLTETYAGILISKVEGSLRLIAQVVRDNSKIYPRPVPLDIFTISPFDLTEEEIQDCLAKISEQEEYKDIARTTTSVGTVFLYSNRHLEPDYAFTLAESLDVGQVNNP
jgi:hypothetical protein